MLKIKPDIFNLQILSFDFQKKNFFMLWLKTISLKNQTFFFLLCTSEFTKLCRIL